jgi:hypothetical protein
LCVDAGTKVNCSMSPYNTYPYCNSKLAPADRAADLASRLSVLDWQNILQNNNRGLANMGIRPIKFNEALHGCVTGLS